MNLDAAAAENFQSAKQYGWGPPDFGAHGWGEDLVEAVVQFQKQRILPETGVVDHRTWRTFTAWRQAVKDRMPDREGKARHKLVYDQSHSHPLDPRHHRAAIFRRVGVVVSTLSDLSWISRVYRAGNAGYAIVDVTRSTRPVELHLARTGCPTVIAVASPQDVKAAASRGLLDLPGRGVVVTTVMRGNVSTLRRAWHRALATVAAVGAVTPRLGTALALRPWCRPTYYADGLKPTLDEMIRSVDVFMPVLDMHSAPETDLPMIMSDFSARAGTGIWGWLYPMIDTRASDNYLHRVRALLRTMEVQGYGFTEVPRDRGDGAFFGPLPKVIRRIDGEGHGTEDLRRHPGRDARIKNRNDDPPWPPSNWQGD